MAVNDLRLLHERAMQSIQGDDPLSAIRRASLLAASSKFAELGAGVSTSPAFEIYLADESSPQHAVSANEAGDILKRVQKAVARLARARRFRLADVVRLKAEDFAAARLNVAGASFGSLKIDLLPDLRAGEPAEGEVPLSGPTWAEVGLVELVRSLPEGVEDSASIASLPAASPVVRRAVADVIDGLKGAPVGIGLKVTRGSGEVISSRMSPAQVQEINAVLAVAREERQTMRLEGRLDGLRTRRQIFYFETKAGSEIHGFVDESLMEAVKQNIDREVEVQVEVTIERSQSGKASQRHYRLMSVGGVQSEIPATDSPSA